MQLINNITVSFHFFCNTRDNFNNSTPSLHLVTLCILPCDFPDQMIVDIEWGAFGDNGVLDFMRTQWDRAVDDQSLLVHSYTYVPLLCVFVYPGKKKSPCFLLLTEFYHEFVSLFISRTSPFPLDITDSRSTLLGSTWVTCTEKCC